MKAIADTRGWQHQNHRDLFTVADRLTTETGRAEIRNLFQIASATHQNFYEGWLTTETLKGNLANIERLLAILEDIPAV